MQKRNKLTITKSRENGTEAPVKTDLYKFLEEKHMRLNRHRKWGKSHILKYTIGGLPEKWDSVSPRKQKDSGMGIDTIMEQK